MKKLLIPCSLAFVLMLTGCKQSEDELIVNEEFPVSVEASIGGTGGSRYAGDTPNEAVFAKGDQIGLAYQVGTDAATGFVKWTLNESSWSPATEMNWKNIGEEHTFYAFYPYGDEVLSPTLGQVKMPALNGQDGTMTSVAARDFLVATKTMKYSNGGTVSFTGDDAFDHVSSLVVLTLKNAGDLTSATIDNISLSGTELVAESNYSFTDTDGNPVSLVDGDNDGIMSADFTNGNEMTEDKKFYFVVNSGTVDLSAVTLSITYTSAGDGSYKATKTGLNKADGHTRFQSGYVYNYGITVTTGNVLTISNHTINTWKEGDSIDITIDNSEKQEDDE